MKIKDIFRRYKELTKQVSVLKSEVYVLKEDMDKLIENLSYIHKYNGYRLVVTYDPNEDPNAIKLEIYIEGYPRPRYIADYYIPIKDVEKVANAMVKIKEMVE